MTRPGAQKLRSIRYGQERLPAGHDLPRHRHFDAYATVVLEGSFEQAGYAGRYALGPGDILIQPTLDSHSNRMLSPGVKLLRLPWTRDASFGGVYRGMDIDTLQRTAAHCIGEATSCLEEILSGAHMVQDDPSDWEDVVVWRMRADRHIAVQKLAEEMHLSREALSRGFKRRYGASPVSFRTEMRAREAWLRLTGTRDPLSAIASEVGFADQSHMTRAVYSLTHETPSMWRIRFSGSTLKTGTLFTASGA
jgi:AraC-like DNA-binding protein